MTVEARFWAKVAQVGNVCECWIWTAGTNRGYGRFSVGDKMVYAHRFAYEQANGPVDRILDLDHLCRDHACVNPYHLEPVTHAENVRRGLCGKINNHYKSRLTCIRGHEFNRVVNGARRCTKCATETQRLNRQRKRVSI